MRLQQQILKRAGGKVTNKIKSLSVGAQQVVRIVSLERAQNRRKGKSICNRGEVRLVPNFWQGENSSTLSEPEHT